MVGYWMTRVCALLSIYIAFSIPAKAADPKIDFNGDGRADVFLRNLFTGDIAAWLVDGSRVLQSASYGTVPPSSGWTPLGVGDFNGDGRTDLLWYNVYTGEVAVWLLDGGGLLQSAPYGTVQLNSGWTPLGAGGFNGDGRNDVFWYNVNTGDPLRGSTGAVSSRLCLMGRCRPTLDGLHRL